MIVETVSSDSPHLEREYQPSSSLSSSPGSGWLEAGVVGGLVVLVVLVLVVVVHSTTTISSS